MEVIPFFFSFFLSLCFCFYILGVLAACPVLETVSLHRGCPRGPKPRTPGVLHVWPLCATLLWLSFVCSGLTARCDLALVCLSVTPAATAVGVLMSGTGPRWDWPQANDSNILATCEHEQYEKGKKIWHWKMSPPS